MKKAKGEVSLIVLLVMVMLATIGLGVISRSVTEITTSKIEEESQKAFSAAEAGIEDALKQSELSGWSTGYVPLKEDGASYNATAGKTKEFFLQVENGETAEVKLNGNVSGGLEIKWTIKNSAEENPTCSDQSDTKSGPAVLEVIRIIDDGTSILARRSVYNPRISQSLVCELAENFDSADWVDDDLFLNKKTITVATSDKYLRLKPLYNTTTIKVTLANGNPLPEQAYVITSLGKAIGGEQRAVEVIKYFPSLPTIFDYVLFSGVNISK